MHLLRLINLRHLIVTAFILFFSVNTLANEWSGYLSGEFRGFFDSPADNRQHNNNLSFSSQIEYSHSWDNDTQTFAFVPFIRIDENDKERSHADIRELTWLKAADNWELRIGIRKLFWGVTESQHLVDIINQTDLVESPDGEDKLGQPMLNFSYISNWGTLDFFLLPYFRERSFPGIEGRIRSQPYIDTDQAIYESSRKEKHFDYALRWSHTIGNWDIGLSHFSGTHRDPRLVPGNDGQGNPALIPHYDLIDKTGVDLQATIESWLWKLELIRRSGQGETFFATTAGFEYTLYGILSSSADLGLLFEYLYDDRDANATSPFQNDIFLGLRLTLNDEQDTQFLIGMIEDMDTSSTIYSLEASRRIGNSWKLTAEARFYQIDTAADPLHAFRQDDHAQLELAYFF